MAWITHKPVIHTTTSTNVETAAIFAGSGITNNACFRVVEPSGTDGRLWVVWASLDGINFSSNSQPIGTQLILSGTETVEGITPVNFTAPYYKMLVYTSSTPKTFTITFSEEI